MSNSSNKPLRDIARQDEEFPGLLAALKPVLLELVLLELALLELALLDPVLLERAPLAPEQPHLNLPPPTGKTR